MDVVVHANLTEAATAVADRVVDLMAQTEGRFSIGLAGGSTPAALYEILSQETADWSQVDLWLSDARWVAHDDHRSNGRMARETLVDHIDATFHRPRWSEGITPDESAAEYEKMLRSLHVNRQPDLILLGLGHDGHTASLFPGSTALAERHRWYVANEIPATGEPRLTATYPLLWSADHLLVLATGAGKAEAVRDSFDGISPAGHIDEGDSEVEWHIDQAAASLLS